MRKATGQDRGSRFVRARRRPSPRRILTFETAGRVPRADAARGPLGVGVGLAGGGRRAVAAGRRRARAAVVAGPAGRAVARAPPAGRAAAAAVAARARGAGVQRALAARPGPARRAGAGPAGGGRRRGRARAAVRAGAGRGRRLRGLGAGRARPARRARAAPRAAARHARAAVGARPFRAARRRLRRDAASFSCEPILFGDDRRGADASGVYDIERLGGRRKRSSESRSSVEPFGRETLKTNPRSTRDSAHDRCRKRDTRKDPRPACGPNGRSDSVSTGTDLSSRRGTRSRSPRRRPRRSRC